MYSAKHGLSGMSVQGTDITFFILALSSLPLPLSRLIMSPWNLVRHFPCNHSLGTPVDFVLPQRPGVKDLICVTESGKGHVQEPRKSSPHALQTVNRGPGRE